MKKRIWIGCVCGLLALLLWPAKAQSPWQDMRKAMEGQATAQVFYLQMAGEGQGEAGAIPCREDVQRALLKHMPSAELYGVEAGPLSTSGFQISAAFCADFALAARAEACLSGFFDENVRVSRMVAGHTNASGAPEQIARRLLSSLEPESAQKGGEVGDAIFSIAGSRYHAAVRRRGQESLCYLASPVIPIEY